MTRDGDLINVHRATLRFGSRWFSVVANYPLRPPESAFWPSTSAANGSDFEVLSAFVPLSGQSNAESLDCLRELQPSRAILDQGYENNPCLDYAPARLALSEAVCGGEYSVLAFSNYLLVVDHAKRRFSEFFSDPFHVESRRGFPRRLFVPRLKYILSRLDTMLLHASAVADASGNAFVFLGPSGAGKSTVASLARPHHKVLADDKIVTELSRGEIWAYASPFDHAEREPGAGRVRALLWLKQGQSFALKPKSRLEMVADVWRDNFREWWALNPAMRRTAFELCCDMLTQVPVFEMTFTRDHVDWEQLERIADSASAVLS